MGYQLAISFISLETTEGISTLEYDTLSGFRESGKKFYPFDSLSIQNNCCITYPILSTYFCRYFIRRTEYDDYEIFDGSVNNIRNINNGFSTDIDIPENYVRCENLQKLATLCEKTPFIGLKPMPISNLYYKSVWPVLFLHYPKEPFSKLVFEFTSSLWRHFRCKYFGDDVTAQYFDNTKD